jgi:hypothetical protein
MLVKLDTIVKLRIFEIGDRQIAAGEELLYNIITADSVMAK